MVLRRRGPKAPGGALGVYLQRTVNLTAVEHEVEEVQVVDGRLPGHVVSFVLQVGGGSEGQHRAHHLCSLFSNEREDKKTRPSVNKPAASLGKMKNLTGFSVHPSGPGSVPGTDLARLKASSTS